MAEQSSPKGDGDDSKRLPATLASPTRSASFKSPKVTSRPNLSTRAKSFNGFGLRLFDVDGYPLPHWDKSNFQPERDESCRVVYKPKDGSEFFQKNLRKEDYVVMRRSAMEQPFFSKYNRFFPKKGHFCCKACGNALYSHQTKLTKSDGWPSFGACVDGAVGMLTPEQRKRREQRETNAAVCLQAFFRGSLTRANISEKVGMLIQHVMELEKEVEEEILQDDSKSGSLNTASRHGANVGRLSLHSLQDLSLLEEGDSSMSSFESFGDSSFSELPVVPSESKAKQRQAWKSSGKSSPTGNSTVAASAACLALKRSQDRDLNSSEMAPMEDLIEIHCHRCKSFLGNVFEEENRGQDGETTMYKERHRVNGRALKYVEDNLPKRTAVTTSLLFANRSQHRLMGLRPAEPAKEKPEFVVARPFRGPFVSPRSKTRRSVADSFQSPSGRAKPGVGVRFLSPIQSPKDRKLSSKQKKMENFFLNRSVH